MDRAASRIPPPTRWRPLLAGLGVLMLISSVVVWTWYTLGQSRLQEYQQRFALNAQTLGEIVQARMRSYEIVLRGMSSAFSGSAAAVSLAQWNEIVDQMRVQELFPGISSIVWSRSVPAGQLDDFLTRNHADGRPDYRVFPEGAREHYLPIQYIGPLNERTRPVIGLDLLTQELQRPAILQAVDEGRASLSEPLPDLYVVSPEPLERTGIIMYFPVYQTGAPPATVEARRATHIGMTDAAFHARELVEGIFGSRLRLFQVSALDVEANRLVFDSRSTHQVNAPPGWQPILNGQLDLPIYGRIWRLFISSTPEYEQTAISRNHDLILVMGLSTSLFMALLAGGFVYQRDRQIYVSQQVEAQLRAQAEQLIVASRYKSEFLANMSHELRTPLNSILILSDQLRQNAAGNLNEKQTRHADIVYRAGSELLQLINDVLDLAKVEAGRMQISMEPLNLQDLLVDLDAGMRPLAEAKHLHLYIPQLTPETGLPQRVYTDRVRLHQILRNLLSNAIKFTDAGQVHLGVYAGKKQADGSVVIHFVVRDTGIGIDPAYHSQVFEAFQQFDGSTRRRHGGTGLGLAITRQLVLALDGEIDMESVPGQGSTFTVRLPMQSVQAPQQTYAAPQRAGVGPALLIVEDDANFAAIIVEQAHANGFSSVHCTTGQQAMELLKNETFTAVILDILLPDISGWQLFRRLRALPAHHHTPVHVISCLPQPVGLQTETGIHYLTKPIGNEALNQVFANLEQSPAMGPALLLVEDVEAEREHYRQQLTALGFAVTACGSAQQARAVWVDTKFDVLVMDLNLPDQDGFALLDGLNALRPLQGTRVVVNTGLDVARDGLQRLHGYSAVVVRKTGDDTAMLEQAVQGFLQGVSNAVNDCASADATPSAPRPALKGRRVLLVDDDMRNVYAMSALLDDFGLHVTTAGNGEEAIAHFAQAPQDLILMDMSMPVMDGYTATNLLKTEHGCTIPIIALTAHAMKGDREKCLAAGADDYIAKPVNREELRTLLERWLAPEQPESAGS